MANSPPSPQPLHELTSGERADFFALLAEKTRGLTREGKAYYSCKFRDARRTATLMVWSDSSWFEGCSNTWDVGQFYKLRAVYEEHEKYGPQLGELLNIREVEERDKESGFDPSALVEHSRFDADEMLEELVSLAGQYIEDEPLQRLVVEILEEHSASLKTLPGSRDRYYPFAGGLLEHTLAVTRSCIDHCETLREKYAELEPPLNRGLVVAAAVLHEVGRVRELSDDILAPVQTVAGKLFGHQILARDIVREKAVEVEGLDDELLQLLEHILLSYLTLPEWGSQRLPLVPEALILHHCDDLDAKMEMYVRCLSRDTAEGPFTERDPFLGRQLLKSRSV